MTSSPFSDCGCTCSTPAPCRVWPWHWLPGSSWPGTPGHLRTFCRLGSPGPIVGPDCLAGSRNHRAACGAAFSQIPQPLRLLWLFRGNSILPLEGFNASAELGKGALFGAAGAWLAFLVLSASDSSLLRERREWRSLAKALSWRLAPAWRWL